MGKKSENIPSTALSNEELIALARVHHYSLSKRQLAEWHRADLLPAPERSWRGRKGSHSIYPSGTAEQMLALCALRARHPHNRRALGWSLWWSGWPVPAHHARAMLTHMAEEWQTEIARLRGDAQPRRYTDLPAATHEKVAESAQLHFLQGLMAGARRRLGPDRFIMFTQVIIEALTGTFSGYEIDYASSQTSNRTDYEARRIVEVGLGFVGKPRRWGKAQRSPLFIDSAQVLVLLSTFLRMSPPGSGLERLSDEDLLQLRDELRQILGLLTTLRSMELGLFAGGARGAVDEVGLLKADQPDDQAFLFLVWCSLRRSEWSSLVDQIIAIFRMMKTLMTEPDELINPGDETTPRGEGREYNGSEGS